MGHAASRPNGCAGAGDGDGDGEVLPSRFARFRRRLRHRLRGAGDDSASAKALAAEDFAGIARIRIVKVRRLRAATPLLRTCLSIAPSFAPLRRGQPRRNPWI